ncbi:MAG: EFR1 family ferrodoxin [Lachnospiraceae bacterium]|nr:EFR1 family ferrodoxin [Lachnospiraceae bacterium]
MLTGIHEVFFSATGTTEKIVKTVSEVLSEALLLPVVTTDFTLPAGRAKAPLFSENELVIFGTPVYAGRVPNVLLPFFKTLEGHGAPAVPVVLYGNRNFDDGLIELRNLLEADGFRTIAGAAFIGEHAFSRILGAGRPDAEDLEKAKDFAAALAVILKKAQEEGRRLPHPAAVEGCYPIRPYYTPRDRQGNPVNILKVKPKVDLQKCSRCGICAKVCPMGSIDPADITLYTGICIKCGACEKKCPEGARYYDDPGYLYHRTELEKGYTRRAEPSAFLP